MSSNCRSEARSVILRLRRYRDRMREITATIAGVPAALEIAVRRRITSLQTDLDNDAHECVIGRRRMVQTECEQQFLLPALQEAAAAMGQRPAPTARDTRANADLQTAQSRIQHYLTQLESRWPTL